MFTGIIQAIGIVRTVQATGADIRATIEAGTLDLSDARRGDSIAVNGVCLTAKAWRGSEFDVDVSAETLRCTTFASLKPGSRVNLEPALRLLDRLGGHLVAGHVDARGRIMSRTAEAASWRFGVSLPPPLSRYVCRKGSICIDGVSLTVNNVGDSEFSVNIIPHTMEHTLFGEYLEGSEVNLEVDLLARYLERLHGTT